MHLEHPVTEQKVITSLGCFPLDVKPQMVNLDQTWDLFSSGDFYCLQKLHVEEWDFMALNCLILENCFFPQGLFFLMKMRGIM